MKGVIIMKLVFKYETEIKELEVSHENLIFDLGMSGEQNGEFRNNITPKDGLILKALLPTNDNLQTLQEIKLYEEDILIETISSINNVSYRVSSGSIMQPDKSFKMGLIERLQFAFKM